MRPQFYTFQVQKFFDDLFGSSSDFLAQNWPFDPSQRFLGAISGICTTVWKILAVIKEKTGKNEKFKFHEVSIKGFFSYFYHSLGIRRYVFRQKKIWGFTIKKRHFWLCLRFTKLSQSVGDRTSENGILGIQDQNRHIWRGYSPWVTPVIIRNPILGPKNCFWAVFHHLQWFYGHFGPTFVKVGVVKGPTWLW